jgi:hypothetical protein
MEPRLLLSAPTSWTAVGVGDGGTNYNAEINPQNPSEMLLASDMGEEFHTTNYNWTGTPSTSTVNWSTLDMTQITGSSWVPNMAFSTNPSGPAGNTVIYSMSVSGGYLKVSVDDGTSWQMVPNWPSGGGSLEGIMYVCVDPHDSNRIVVGMSQTNNETTNPIGLWYTSSAGVATASQPNGWTWIPGQASSGDTGQFTGAFWDTGSGSPNSGTLWFATTNGLYKATGVNNDNSTWTWTPPGGLSAFNFAGSGATAGTVTISSSGAITAISLGAGGSGYNYAPAVEISGDNGTGAFAVANISGGAVTGYTVVTGGSGYSTSGQPTVALSPQELASFTASRDSSGTRLVAITWPAGTSISQNTSASNPQFQRLYTALSTDSGWTDDQSLSRNLSDPAGLSDPNGFWMQGMTTPIDLTPRYVQMVDGDTNDIWIAGVNESDGTPIVYQSTNAGANWTRLLDNGDMGDHAVFSPYGGSSVNGVNASPGFGYTSATGTITLTFTGGGTSNEATGYATIGNQGQVTGVVLTSNGSGYTSMPTITISPSYAQETPNQNVFTHYAGDTGNVNLGMTWGYLGQPTGFTIDRTLVNGKAVMVLSDGGDSFRSDDSGANWVSMTGSMSDLNPEGHISPENNYPYQSDCNETVTYTVVAPTPGAMLIGEADLQIEQSTNGGTSWQRPTLASWNLTPFFNTFFDETYDPRTGNTYAIATGSKMMYQGFYDDAWDSVGQDAVCVSYDKGATWTVASWFPNGETLRTMALDPNNPNIMYLGVATSPAYPNLIPGIYETTNLLAGFNGQDADPGNSYITWTRLAQQPTRLGSGATAGAATIVSGGITAIAAGSGGWGYTSVAGATVSITGGGSGATATAVVTNGQVTGFIVTNGGSGYTNQPTITITSNGAFGAQHPVDLYVLGSGPDAGDLLFANALRYDDIGDGDNHTFVQTAGVWLGKCNAGIWTWTDETPGPSVDPSSYMSKYLLGLTVDPNDPTQQTWFVTDTTGTGYPGDTYGAIFKTTNGGATWTQWYTNSTWGSAGGAVYIRPNTTEMYFPSSTNGVWYTSNYTVANPTFVRLNLPAGDPWGIFGDPWNPNRIWVTTGGDGAWYGDCGTSAILAPPLNVTATLVAGAGNTDAVKLAWTMSGVPTSYTIQDEVNGGTTWSVAATDPSGYDSSFLVTGLSSGTQYVFDVIANDPAGSSAPSGPTSMVRIDAAAGLIAYEGFTQAAGNLNGTGSGTGWATGSKWATGSNAWTVASGSIGASGSTAATELATSGNSVDINTTSSSYNATRTLAANVGVQGTVVWASFLTWVDQGSSKSNNELYFGTLSNNAPYNGIGFGLSTGGGASPPVTVYTYANGVATLYIGPELSQISTYAANKANFLVARLDFESTGVGVQLYVDPTPGLLNAGTPVALNVGVWNGPVLTGMVADTLPIAGTTTFSMLSAGGGSGDHYDEIRLGNTYAGIAPPNSKSPYYSIPNSPSSTTATVASQSEIDLNWTAGPNSGTQTPEGYIVLQKTGGGSYAAIATLPGSTVTGYKVTDLSPATLYTFEVEAYNGTGASSATAATGQTTWPLAPTTGVTNLAVTAPSAGQFNLTWTNNISGATGYYVEYSNDMRSAYDANAIVWTRINAGNVGSYNVTGLPGNTLYYFRVIPYSATSIYSQGNAVYNAAECSNGPISNYVTLVSMAAPTNLTAQAVGSGTVAVTFNDMVPLVDHFDARCTSDGGATWSAIQSWTPTPTTPPLSLTGVSVVPITMQVTGLSANTIYQFEVRAVAAGSASVGAWSAPATGRTVAAATGLMAYDGFDYSQGPLPNNVLLYGDGITGDNGGIGFSGPWSTLPNTEGTESQQVAPGSLADSNSTVAQNLLTASNSFYSFGNGTIKRGLATTTPAFTTGSQLWASFLYRPEGTNDQGDVLELLDSQGQGAGHGNNMELGQWIYSSNYGFYIAGAAENAWSTGPAVGQTVFEVWEVVCTSTNNYTVKLWVDPNPASALPTPTYSDSFTNTSMSTYNAVELNGGYATGAAWDELRLSYGAQANSSAVMPVESMAPSGLTAVSNPYTDIVTLNWSDNASGNNKETGFHILRSTDGQFWTQVGSVGAGVTAYTDSAITAGVTYYYAVASFNACGDSAWSNQQSGFDPIAGDINGDGLVDVADYDIWAANVGATNATWSQGDLNGDHLVDVADYDIWAANVGATASSASDVAGQSALPAVAGPASVASTPASGQASPASPDAGTSWEPVAMTADAPAVIVAGQGVLVPIAPAADWATPALAEDAQTGLLTTLTGGPAGDAGQAPMPTASTLATQQAQSVWSGPQRDTTLTAKGGADFDMLAHVKPLRIADQWAIAHEKPGDFTGDLPASPLDALDLQLI